MKNSYGLASSASVGVSGKHVQGFLLFVLLVVLVSHITATQYLVVRLAKYPHVIGLPLFSFEGFSFYPPWGIWLWKPYLPVSLFHSALRVGILTFAIPQIVFLIIALQAFLKPKGLYDLHGSARWATLTEIRDMGLLEGVGVYIGGFYEKSQKLLHYLRHNGPEHILCFAPTRSGKGVGLILPTLLSWGGSLFCLDIKGENWALTAWFRKHVLGHLVFRFDVADDTGKGAKFNPLQEIRLSTLKAIPDVQNMATALVDPNGEGLKDYWAQAGFSFLAGVMMHTCVKILYTEKRYANLMDLCLALANEDGGIAELYDEMLESDHAAWIEELFPHAPARHGTDIHTFVASSGQEMKNKAENEASGVVGTALSKLGLYRDPVILMNTSVSDFTIADLMEHEKPVDVYLVTSPADIARITPLIRLVTTLVLSRRTEKMEFAGGRSVAGYKHRLLMMLDEFTSIGKLPIIEKAISYCAGYGIKLYLIVQDVTQLNGAYGKESGVLGNCHIKIAYATNNPETSKLLSEMTGKTTVVQEKSSLSGSRGSMKKSNSLNVQETARDLLTPDECSRLPGAKKNSKGEVTEPGDMLIFVAGQPPIYGKQILYFKDPEFMQRAMMGAPDFSDSIYYPREEPAKAVSVTEESIIEQAIEDLPPKSFSDYYDAA